MLYRFLGLLAISLTVFSSCHFVNDFQSIETDADEVYLSDSTSVSVQVYQAGDKQVRACLSIGKIKSTWTIDTLSIRLFDNEAEEGGEFPPEGLQAFDAMRSWESIGADGFSELNDSLKTLTPGISTYFAYDFGFSVPHVDAHKTYVVQLFSIMTAGEQKITIAKNIFFKRNKKLRTMRLFGC